MKGVYETFGLGKGTNQRKNLEAIKVCLQSGIIPIPNIIIGFPEDTFEGIRTTMEGVKKLGIHVKPHFATPYPGSEWYYTYKHEILKQYNDDLEAFVVDLGDASQISAVISNNFTGVELIGLQEIMRTLNFRLLDEVEAHWKANRRLEDATPYTSPQTSFNIVKKNIRAPIEVLVKV